MPSYRNREKSYHKGKGRTKQESTPEYSDSVVVKAFQEFQKELDTKHDKFERIIKLGRDITIESKRAIFGLQALSRANDPVTDSKKIMSNLKKLVSVHFKAIASELEGEDPYQYLRAYSSGLQEYIEAITFYYYIIDGALYNWNQLKKDFVFNIEINDGSNEISPNGDQLTTVTPQTISTKEISTLIPLSEYILGIQDLTGELMRHCINSFAAGKIDNGFSTCNFVKTLHIGMLHLGNTSMKEFGRKLFVLKQSLLKMETACYMMHVRGSEILHHMFPDVVLARQEEYDESNYLI